MIRARIGIPTAWQAWQLLVGVLLFLLPLERSHAQATDPALQRLVHPSPGTRPLGVVLAELSRQGHLPLSYSSSLVPLTHSSHVPAGPARPLGVVLKEVLAAEHLSFGLLNGQLVLWPTHVAAPAGVQAVNGAPSQPTPAAKGLPAPSLTTDATVTASGQPAQLANNGPTGNRPLPQRPATIKAVSSPAASTSSTSKAASQSTGAAGKALPRLQGPSGSRTATTHAAQRVAQNTKPTTNSPPGSRPSVVAARTPTSGKSVTKQMAGNARTSSPAASAYSVSRGPSHVAQKPDARSAKRPTMPRPGAANNPTQYAKSRSPRRRGTTQSDTSVAPANAQPGAGRPQPASEKPPANPAEAPVATLPSTAAAPSPTLPTDAPAPAPESPAANTTAPAQRPIARPTKADEALKEPFSFASLLRPSYLHAEAWGSETLPINAAVKVGVPRLYLALGIAAGPRGRQSGGVAGGVGLGTAFESRGRFTPSLDLMQWFVSGDRDSPGGQLTQLRPLVGWQIKQGGRLQLIAGPTLNLSTGPRRNGGPTPTPRARAEGELGEGQWLWYSGGDDRSYLRIWPGVQLGLRF